MPHTAQNRAFGSLKCSRAQRIPCTAPSDDATGSSGDRSADGEAVGFVTDTLNEMQHRRALDIAHSFFGRSESPSVPSGRHAESTASSEQQMALPVWIAPHS